MNLKELVNQERVAQLNANAKLDSIINAIKFIEHKRISDHQQLKKEIENLGAKCSELGRLIAEKDCASTISNLSATSSDFVFNVCDSKVFEEYCLKFVEQFKNIAHQDEHCKLMAIRYIHFYYFILILILFCF
jgi:hypothetical protein